MMTNPFTCDDKATLVAYMYGEVDAAVRAQVDKHLATCAACAAEVTALGDVRAELGSWIPPDVELGFTIVRKTEQPANVLRPAVWWRTVPAWAQAAAAVLVVAAGLGIANVQVRSGPDGLSVSTGWMKAQEPALSAPASRDAAGGEVEGWKTALVSLEQQLRNEIRATRDQQPTAVRVAAAPADDATLRRVQQLIAASEERQSRELAIRMTQFASDINMQRRADLQLIRQGFGQQEELMLRQRQMMNNVLRVSASGQQ
jgi:anti-sigma factor RsiW